MRRLPLLLAALALLLAACAEPQEEAGADGYELYYAAQLDQEGGDAVRARRVQLTPGASPDAAALAEELLTQLLVSPAPDGLRSPFPGGTRLQKVSVAGGRATVDLSEQYAQLSGIDLSVADCCVTLTLTQLTGINAVRVTVNGRELPYRKTQLLTAADALLSSREDALRPINVLLYFLDTQTGLLRAQAQTLALYEGQSRVSAVLDALLRGPEGDDGLRALLPEHFSVLSSRIDDGICYVNLDSAAPLPEDEALRALAVESLAHSILSLSGVDEVQFLIDGEAVPQWTAVFAETAEALES